MLTKVIDLDLEKKLDYIKATLGMEGLKMSKKTEKLIKAYNRGEKTEDEVLKALREP